MEHSQTVLRKVDARTSGPQETVETIGKEDLRNVKVQEQLIQEYLQNYKVSEEILNKVFEINKKYNTEVEAKEEIARNINWNVESLEWDNLFNYGENNKINFKNLQGIVGIFGKNYSGKSSVIDSILYALFNTTSKGEKKVSSIVNTAKKTGIANLKLSINDNEYVIARSCEKSVSKKGVEDAKTTLNFVGDGVSLNGDSRVQTDANIKKMFGTIDDFMLTSMASQLDSLSFIREGSTKRKEILAKFLDLEIFEEKFKLAKDNAMGLKASLKRYEGKDYQGDILRYRESLAQFEAQVALTEGFIAAYKKEKAELQTKINELDAELHGCVDH